MTRGDVLAFAAGLFCGLAVVAALPLKLDRAQCVDAIESSWLRDLDQVPTLEAREAIRNMTVEACEGLQRDGVVR